MKSKDTIEVEFSRALTRADELIKVANSLTDLANSIGDRDLKSLETVWKGNNAQAVSDRGRGLVTDLFGIAQDLLRISATIRNTANLVYNAEKTAIFMAYH